jgi:hypothetical protein
MSDFSPTQIFVARLTRDHEPYLQLAIEAPDDSMENFGITKGSVCILEISTEVYPDRIHAVSTPEGSIVFRLPGEVDRAHLLGFVHSVYFSSSYRPLHKIEAHHHRGSTILPTPNRVA